MSLTNLNSTSGLPLTNALSMLETEGYLLLPVAGPISERITAAFEAAYQFFRSPTEEKLTNKLPQDMGYRPVGIEYSQSPERPDQAESFAASVRTSDAKLELRSPSARFLYDRMLQAIDVLEPIVEAVSISLAKALSGRSYEQILRGAFRRWSRLQINYSRPAYAASDLINDPHEDGDLLTITCSTCPGLELQQADGGFVPVTTSSELILVMPGEITWLLSGGRVRPIWHRVRRESRYEERMSLLFFADIDPSVCQPWVRNEVNANVDIGRRVLESVTRFGLTGFMLD